MLFLRASVDPAADLVRGFSGVHNSWVDTPEEIEDAILEAYPDHPSGTEHLREPRQDPVTGWWCWEPEDGLSSFGFENEAGMARAMERVHGYASHLSQVAVFQSLDFDIGQGADGEDVFRDGEFMGFVELGAGWDVCESLVSKAPVPG